MPDPHSSALLRRAGGSLLATGLAFVLVFAILGCAGLAAALAPKGGGIIVFGVVFGGVVMLMPPLAIGFAVMRSRVLDPEFRALGLEGSGWLPNIREYHGVINGRQVDVLYGRRGPLLQVTVEANVASTLGVGTKTVMGAALGGLVSTPEVPGLPASFSAYVVRAQEPAWAHDVLGTAGVAEEVRRLVADPNERELRTVALRPGAILVSRHYFRVPPEGVSEQVESMLRLAAAVERAPAPQTPVEVGALERQARASPTRLGALIAFGLVGATLLGVLVVMAAAFAIMFLSGGPR